MIDPIEKFFQIKVNYPFVALRNVLLRLGHGVMRRSTRSKPVAALGKRSSSIASAEPASPLVDEAIQHGWHIPVELHSWPTNLWDRLR
jgi:hypothetical protein